MSLVTVEYLSVSCLRPDGAVLEESQSEVNFKTFSQVTERSLLKVILFSSKLWPILLAKLLVL